MVRKQRKPEPFSDAFIRVLNEHRKQSGLSINKLAERSGLHVTSVGLIMRALRTPNVDTANSLAEALGVKLSQLVVEAETGRK